MRACHWILRCVLKSAPSNGRKWKRLFGKAAESQYQPLSNQMLLIPDTECYPRVGNALGCCMLHLQQCIYYSAFILQNKPKTKYPHPSHHAKKLAHALTSWCQSPLPTSICKFYFFFYLSSLTMDKLLPQKWKLQFLMLIPLQNTDLHNCPWKKNLTNVMLLRC